ncbi:MAG: hypothetical protein ACTSXP_08965 [Promethearchaeota archaeon]
MAGPRKYWPYKHSRNNFNNCRKNARLNGFTVYSFYSHFFIIKNIDSIGDCLDRLA